MSLLSGGQIDFFGLDIGSTAVRAVQLRGVGDVKALDRYGQAPVEGTAALSDAAADKTKVAHTIQQLIGETRISTKNVAVNIPSQRVFSTVLDMDRLSNAELEKTIRWQADSIIPTPMADSKVDWAVIGDSPKDPHKIEVLLSSVANSFVEERLSMLESVGLNVIAIEPDSMALARSMVARDSQQPQLVLDIGNTATDMVITMGGVPRLARAVPTGFAQFVRAAVQTLGIDEMQAIQFVSKFGLSKDKLEGKVYDSIVGVVDGLVAEIEKSIKFFQARYPTAVLERIIVTGGASSMPELPLYIANKFGINVEIGDAWRNVNTPSSKQNELLAVANHFGVAVGLAERNT